MAKHDPQIAYGIDALVEKLRTEGVEQAQAQSRDIVSQAEQQAQQMIAQARRQCDQLRHDASEKIATDQKAAQDALRVAYRDLVLDIKSHLLTRFSQDVERLVSESLQAQDVVRDLVLAAAQRIVNQADIEPGDQLSIQLPESVLELEDIIKNPSAADSDALADFVFARQRSLLEQGIEFHRGDDDLAGIVIKLNDKKISVDLTDDAIAKMLLTYLNPRFRALLDGIIH